MPTPDNLTNAKEGLSHNMIGKKKVTSWKSKAVVHKVLQTLTLIHDSDLNHISEWKDSYEAVDVVITKVTK